MADDDDVLLDEDMGAEALETLSEQVATEESVDEKEEDLDASAAKAVAASAAQSKAASTAQSKAASAAAASDMTRSVSAESTFKSGITLGDEYARQAQSELDERKQASLDKMREESLENAKESAKALQTHFGANDSEHFDEKVHFMIKEHADAAERWMSTILDFYKQCRDELETPKNSDEKSDLLHQALSSVSFADFENVQKRGLYDANNQQINLSVKAVLKEARGENVSFQGAHANDSGAMLYEKEGGVARDAHYSADNSIGSNADGISDRHSAGAGGNDGGGGDGAGSDALAEPFTVQLQCPYGDQLSGLTFNYGKDVYSPSYRAAKTFYNDLCSAGYMEPNEYLEGLFAILELDSGYYHKVINSALSQIGSLIDGDLKYLLSGVNELSERLAEREFDDDYIPDDAFEVDSVAKKRFEKIQERKREHNKELNTAKRLHPDLDLGADLGSSGLTYGFKGEQLDQNGFLKVKTGELGVYSPSLMDIIDGNKILYVNLSCLTDTTNGQNVGKLILTSLAYCAGKLNAEHRVPKHRVSLFVDEASELADESLVQMLNKSRSANFAIFLATQSYADLVQRTESKERAEQIMANCNNLICMRVNDVASAQVVTKLLAPTVVCEKSSTISYSSDGTKLQNMSTSHTLKQKECALFEPSLLPQLPDFEFIARLANGACYKGFVPIISEPPKEFAHIVSDFVKD